MINWRKGLLRLWFVFSLAWISFFGWEYYDGIEKNKFWRDATTDIKKRVETAIKREENGIETAARSSRELEQALDEAYQHMYQNQSRANDATYLGPTVPIGLIIIGGIVLWIGRGFKTKDK